MKFWPITLHVELHFDSLGVEPNPWWLPFLWVRHPWEHRSEADLSNGFILRCGVFGVHFCAAIHWYGNLNASLISREDLTP